METDTLRCLSRSRDKISAERGRAEANVIADHFNVISLNCRVSPNSTSHTQHSLSNEHQHGSPTMVRDGEAALCAEGRLDYMERHGCDLEGL